MQRYELGEEGNPEKFWEIWLDGLTVFMRFGKIDTDGQKKLKKVSTADAAKKEVDRFVAEKIKQGYKLVGEIKVAKTSPTTLPLDAGSHRIGLRFSPKSADDPYADVDWVRVGVPDEIEAVCRRALAVNPKDRYPTAAELWAAFAQIGRAHV